MGSKRWQGTVTVKEIEYRSVSSVGNTRWTLFTHEGHVWSTALNSMAGLEIQNLREDDRAYVTVGGRGTIVAIRKV